MLRSSFEWVVVFTVLGPSCVACAAPDFATEIQPLFQRSCYPCHGPEKQKSGYRLDVRDSALRGGSSGTAAIVPHNAESSPLFRFVVGADPDTRMPPEESGVPAISADEAVLLKAWIDAGPSWPDEHAGVPLDEKPHWSLQPLVSPPLPGPAQNPIDAFVHAKLADKGLSPSQEADRRTLLRRVYFDLTGLPPRPEEVEAFTNDPDPLAYEKVVDELLASPRHGERWARHWLDTIHFADSHGYEHDIARNNAWRFRDYVIAALNQDTPWPRFIREQLAADVFFPDEPGLTPALGFLGAGTFDFSTYSTAPVTFDYLDRDDLVTQTMAAFVSTTANCARCHAHKFDPISQEDYYALQADFAGVLKGDVAYDEDPAVARERRRWNEVIAAAARQDETVLLAPENMALVEHWLADRGPGAEWRVLEPETFVSAEGASLTRKETGVVVAGGNLPDKDTYTITTAIGAGAITALRLDVLTDDSLPTAGPGRAENGNFHLSEVEVRVFAPGEAAGQVVAIRRATADFNQADWDIARAVDGNMGTAWGIDPEEGKPHHAVFELAEKLEAPAGARLVVALKQLHGRGHVIGAFRLSVTADPPERAAAMSAALAAALAVPDSQRSPAQRLVVSAHVMQLVAEDALRELPAPSYVYAAAKNVEVVTGDPPTQHKSLPEPKVVHLLERGDFDKPREVVGPGALSALTHLPARFALEDPAKEGGRRAALADWIAHRENVLTWRSVINRVWHYHFGRGLCDTPSDFGEMGGTPSHPELIDWLAVWFRDEADGSLKKLHRLIMTSDTYRQSCQERPDAAAIDADNRLLWRQYRMRLDADAYRDFTLAVSGTLDLIMGGPGVQHFKQSKGPQLTPALDYVAFDRSSPGASRRGIYRFVWRGIADPFMEALDFPDLGLLTPVRGFSASSLQALTLYNNDFVLYYADAMARRVAGESPDLEAQVRRAVALAWLRTPTEEEQQAFASHARTFGPAALCRVLLNSNEFLFLD